MCVFFPPPPLCIGCYIFSHPSTRNDIKTPCTLEEKRRKGGFKLAAATACMLLVFKSIRRRSFLLFDENSVKTQEVTGELGRIMRMKVQFIKQQPEVSVQEVGPIPGASLD